MDDANYKIWLAMRIKIQSLNVGLTVAWPAQKTIPADKDYLSISNVSAPPERVLIKSGQKHNRTGQLILTAVHRLGQNVEVYSAKAGEIADHFKDGTRMSYKGVCVEVTAQPQVQSGYRDNGYWHTPVIIPWRSFA